MDTYGLRKLSPERLRKELAVAPGSPLPPSKETVEERLEKLPNVVRARVEATCCADGKAILYVGVEERGAPHFDVRTPPSETVNLPEEVVAAYQRFQDALAEAERTGDVSEHLATGHSLVSDATARALQERFVPLAEAHLESLKKVARDAYDDDQRAIAVYLLGYAPNKLRVVNDLQYALQDPDLIVRRNAMRALIAIAAYAQRTKDDEIRLAPTWFVEMLNSIRWTDRREAAEALVTLTETRDPRVIETLRERALPSLVQMARWQHLPHALPGYLLLGRVLGVQEAELHAAWERGERETVIAKAK